MAVVDLSTEVVMSIQEMVVVVHQEVAVMFF
jgi:hypothetical protein